MQRLKVRAMWHYVRRQPPSFWLVCAYLFIEYVRPQLVWPALDVIPWAQTMLMLCIVAFVFEGRSVRFPTILGSTFLIFTAILGASIPFAYQPQVAIDNLIDYGSWVVIIGLIINIVTDERRFFIFTLLFLLCSFKMSQHGFRTFVARGGSWAAWGATGGPGWFQNSGEFGIQMCIFIPLSAAFYAALKTRLTKWKKLALLSFPLTGLVSIVATSSRGAVIGIAVVGIWYLIAFQRQYIIRGAFTVLLAGSLIWVLIPEQSKARFEAMGEDDTSIQRLDRWEQGIEMMKAYPVFGVGYKNWQVYHIDHFDHNPWEDGSRLAHNIFIEVGAEIGLAGLLGFLAMIAATFAVNLKTRRLARRTPGDNRFLYMMGWGLDGALIGYLASGFFVTVFYYPYFWMNLALTIAAHTSMRRKAESSAADGRRVGPGYPRGHGVPRPAMRPVFGR